MHQKIADPIQDPKLFQPVKVRVLRSFCIGGKPLQIGEEVSIEFHLMRDLVAIGKAAMVAAEH